MSAKHFTGRERGSSTWTLLFCVVITASASSCRRQRAQTRPAAVLDAAVRPERFAPALRKLGAAHFRSVARFEATVDGMATDSVTTETDVWMDAQGNWRLVELNDKDGGREIVLHGRELGVALRYGKMIRRPAEDPEPQRLLEEGLGGPFAAWELLQGVSTVDDFGDENRAGRQVHVYKLTKSPSAGEEQPAGRAQVEESEGADRRAWRRTLVPTSVEGTVVVDQTTGLPLQVDIRAQYTMRRPATGGGDRGRDKSAPRPSGAPGDSASDVVAMHGAVDVHAVIENIGASPDIARPEAEDLPGRQRTVPEEKALLGGLPRSAAAPKPERGP